MTNVIEKNFSKVNVRTLQKLGVINSDGFAGLRLTTTWTVGGKEVIQTVNTTPIVSIVGDTTEVVFTTRDGWSYSVFIASQKSCNKLYAAVGEILRKNADMKNFTCVVDGVEYTKADLKN